MARASITQEKHSFTVYCEKKIFIIFLLLVLNINTSGERQFVEWMQIWLYCLNKKNVLFMLAPPYFIHLHHTFEIEILSRNSVGVNQYIDSIQF